MRIPVIAIFNSSDDVVEMLRFALEDKDMVVVSGHIDAIKRGELSLIDFLREHDPRVVIYDIAPPYDRNWRFLEHLREAPEMEGRKFVLTTTNAAQLHRLVGTSENVIEIVGKPYDIDAVVSAVTDAAR